jgi:hypothetical protein
MLNNAAPSTFRASWKFLSGELAICIVPTDQLVHGLVFVPIRLPVPLPGGRFRHGAFAWSPSSIPENAVGDCDAEQDGAARNNPHMQRRHVLLLPARALRLFSEGPQEPAKRGCPLAPASPALHVPNQERQKNRQVSVLFQHLPENAQRSRRRRLSIDGIISFLASYLLIPLGRSDWRRPMTC